MNEAQIKYDTSPSPATKAIIRLYKPITPHILTLRIKKLNPYLSCDTRGSGTLFNTKKGRYFMLSLTLEADQLHQKRLILITF